MFLKLGISALAQDHETGKFNLFHLKSNIFSYINEVLFKKQIALFPKLINFFDFCNTTDIGPKFCAVDDLGIFNNYNVQDLIEFQDHKASGDLEFDSAGIFLLDYGIPNHHQQPAKFPTPETMGMSQHPQQEQHQLNHNHIHLHSNTHTHNHNNANVRYNGVSYQNEQPVVVQQQQSFPQNVHNSAQVNYDQSVPFDMSGPTNDNLSHFNLNMIQIGPDVVNERYFDDFVHPRNESFDIQSLYGSSSESYISPLDDEFFKNVSPVSTFSSEDASIAKGRPQNLSTSSYSSITDNVEARNASANINISAPNRKRKYGVRSPINQKASVDYYNVDPIDYLMNNHNNMSTFQQQQQPSKKSFSSTNSSNINNNKHTITVKQENDDMKTMPSRTSSTSESVKAFKSESKKLKVETSEDIIGNQNNNNNNNNSTKNHNNVNSNNNSNDYKFKCSYCDATFKVKGYLTRHIKKHNSSMAFSCPFYQEIPSTVCTTSKKNVFAGTKCHPTGGFSRRDTFKTHLKALHFIYPPGTKQVERNSIGGRCAGCFQYFDNNYQWIVEHIEKGVCEGSVTKSDKE